MDRRLSSPFWFGLLGFLACSASLPSPSLAAQPVRVFALIITNNRSFDGSQPDLQYADDDGARYHRLFQAVAEPGDAALLTRFDRASALAYPELAGTTRPPTRGDVLAARDRLALAIQAANEAEQHTVLYIVYAGHGEVNDGRGQLALEDRLIDGQFLEEQLLERLPARDKHLILDSCDSFFVMNPRKPGGRRWAMPKDMALGFSARHPEVGLFLSTNSESEVFEWSELESGVFSHEVRSGLSGGADADRDGQVSYVELAAFIESANRGIRREQLRPHLFFRGPGGDEHASLFATGQLRGRRIELGAGQTRLWIKGQAGERLLDLHKEPGPLSVIIPGDDQGELAVYVQESNLGQRTTVTEFSASGGTEPVQLAALMPHAPALSARGNHLFGELFTEAYGPAALARYQAEQAAAPAPVFGLNRGDLARMHQYLSEFASVGRSDRSLAATVMLGYGAIAGSTAIALATFDNREQHLNQIVAASGLSASFLTLGLLASFRPSPGERALASFERELKLGPAHGARAFAETDAWVQRMAMRERRRRKFVLWATQFIALNFAASATISVVPSWTDMSANERALNAALFYSGAAFVSALGIAIGRNHAPAERMLKLYREEWPVNVQLAPTVGPSAAGLSVTLSF